MYKTTIWENVIDAKDSGGMLHTQLFTQQAHEVGIISMVTRKLKAREST